MRPEETAWGPWLALRMVRGVGNVVYQTLLGAFVEPAAALSARPSALEAAGIRPELARAITGFAQWPAVEDQLQRVRRAGGRLVTWNDASYPANLRETHDPPPFLFAAGEIEPLDQLAVAVVGSRSPSSYGRQMTRQLSEGLARIGVTVVSGLARGIDAEAHQAALRAGGRTIAVLGSGIDVVYPAEHHSLFNGITKRGAVMSEFLMGTTPEAENFPSRNRIISGVSLGTVVVEATEKSGSLITAHYAVEQGREVFAVPGPVGARSRGPHRLIKQGAKLTEQVEDIIEEIAPRLLTEAKALRLAPVETATEAERHVLAAVPTDGRHVDQIIATTGLSTSQVLAALLGLELKGWVRQLPGQHYISVAGEDARAGG